MTRSGTFVKRIFSRRRHPRAGYAVMVLALVGLGGGYAALAPQPDRAQAAAVENASATDIAKGKQLFQENCASCHGLSAQGTDVGPSLIGVGAAAVHFQVSTGRMPAGDPGVQSERKPPQFSPEEIRQMAAYVASLGGGPPIPSEEKADPTGADVAMGSKLFSANCAQCHNFAGSGGALTGGKRGPPLDDATPRQIYEAMLTGPASMPVFNNSTFTPEQKRAIIGYVVETRQEPNPGGHGLGRFGPVTEGLVGWLVGIGLLVGAALWITAKKKHD